MSVSEIARLLERSTGGVSMRIGIVREMSACVLDKIFSGDFPVYAYMNVPGSQYAVSHAVAQQARHQGAALAGDDARQPPAPPPCGRPESAHGYSTACRRSW